MWGVWVGIFNLISGDVIGYVVAGGYSVSTDSYLGWHKSQMSCR